MKKILFSLILLIGVVLFLAFRKTSTPIKYISIPAYLFKYKSGDTICSHMADSTFYLEDCITGDHKFILK